MDVIRNVLIASGALPSDEPEKKEELYCPLFPEEKTERVRKLYLVAHEKTFGPDARADEKEEQTRH